MAQPHYRLDAFDQEGRQTTIWHPHKDLVGPVAALSACSTFQPVRIAIDCVVNPENGVVEARAQ